MEVDSDGRLERKSSQMSVKDHKLANGRSRSRKQSLVTPSSAKSLVSFPSLSPDNSPGPRPNGSFFTSPVTQTGSVPHTPRRGSTQAPSIVQALIQRSASSRGRTALFEDSPKGTVKEVPGALSYASDEHIEHMIARTGAVALVRQLAEDLAQRDAEMSAFRRRAEERERELKKMLREVEVSNLDIETRLHRVGNLVEKTATGPKDLTIKTGRKQDRQAERATSIPTGIDQMMGEAMRDDVGVNMELDEGYLDSLDVKDKDATLKATDIGYRDIERVSITSSSDSQNNTATTIRGWKDFLWSAKNTSKKTSRTSSVVSIYNEEAEEALRSRASSGVNGRRKGLDEDLFNPLQRASTTQSANNAETQPRKSSTSVASWTTKLFAGNPQANNSGTVRGRSATTGSGASKDSRTPSNASGQTASSAKAALMRVSSMAPDNRSRRNIPPVPPIPTSIKTTPVQAPAVQLPSSPKSVRSAANLGPVEMDTILPPESRPPTDQAYNNKSTDYLTDRFGFIYDQRRRKREAEMLKVANKKGKRNSGLESLNGARDADRISVSSRTDSIQRPETPASVDDKVEGKPVKRWQDYLKKATFPTELLSHTPLATPTTTVVTAETPTPFKRSPTFADVRGSLPSSSTTPEPTASPVTASKAEISKPISSASSAQIKASPTEAEPVKLLLAQLTELHDTLQRERTIKWNEFLRKVRAERRKEGENVSSTASHATAMPEVTLTDGEMVGVAGLGNKGKVGRAKWKEFKQLVLAGIPVAYRAKIWAECTGASALRIPGYYDDLVKNGVDDPEIVAQIQMDINRTMTDNVFFRAGPGVVKLNEVLLAYSRRNPEVGYCQGMNLVTASLLLIMPTAEDAFWLLTSIVENILPTGYYSNTLLASRADQLVLRHYVSTLLPKLSAHLDNLGIELEALTFQWFLSVFTACLSAEALFRVWDVVLCFNDGSTFLFQVALALLKLNEQRLLAEETAGGVYHALGGVSDHEVGIDGLIRGSEALKGEVTREEVDDLRAVAVEEEKRRMGGGEGQEGQGERMSEGNGGLEVRVPMPVEE